MADDDDRQPPFEGFFGALFDRLRELDEEGALDDRFDGANIDFEYTVGMGLGPGAPGRKGHPGFSAPGGRTVDAADLAGAEPDVVTRVDEDGDGYRVVADLSGTGADDPRVALDGDQAVVTDGDAELARVAVGADATRVGETTVANGVFEARIHTDRS
jgi:HSP20 family molecular chaperone IbpA